MSGAPPQPPPPPSDDRPPVPATKKKWTTMEVASPSSVEFDWRNWADLPSQSLGPQPPVPWHRMQKCVHIAGGIGQRGGVLAVQFKSESESESTSTGAGSGGDDQSIGGGVHNDNARIGDRDSAIARSSCLCVKNFDTRKVVPAHELLAADVLRVCGVRVPAGRMLEAAELDEATPHFVATFDFNQLIAAPLWLHGAGLMFREDAFAWSGMPASLLAKQKAEWEAKRAAKIAAVARGDTSVDPVALLEFVSGPTLLQNAGAIKLGAAEYEALGAMCAVDLVMNNWDRLPVGFDNDGNLGNVILEPSSSGSGVVCCAIDSCVTPLEGSALDAFLVRVRSATTNPDFGAAAVALSAASGVEVLGQSEMDALRRGWQRGMVKVSEVSRSGELAKALQRSSAAPGVELDSAVAFVLAVASAVAAVDLGAGDG
jgi:hypothetical protein